MGSARRREGYLSILHEHVVSRDSDTVQLEVAVVNSSKAKLGTNVTHLNAWSERERTKPGMEMRETGKTQSERGCETVTQLKGVWLTR